MSLRRCVLVSLLVLAALLALGGVSSAHQNRLKVVASGLDNPRGLDIGRFGAIYVAEAGRGGNGPCIELAEGPQCAGATGAITRIWHGKQRRRAGDITFKSVLPCRDPALQVVAINASHQRISLGGGGGEGGARAVGRPPCKDAVLTEAGGEATTRVGRWRGGPGEGAGARDVGRAGSVGGTGAKGVTGGTPVVALNRLLRPQADVALAWGRAERTAGGARSRGLRRLARRLHTRRWTTIEGLGPGMKGCHPQETRREHEACRRGEAQPSQRERLAPRGRGQDLLDEPRGNRLLLCPAPSLQDVGAQAIQDTRHPLGVADQDLRAPT